jgi:hypothetical protein
MIELPESAVLELVPPFPIATVPLSWLAGILVSPAPLPMYCPAVNVLPR